MIKSASMIEHTAEADPIWWPAGRAVHDATAPAVAGDHDVDVAVIGAGLSGLAVAHFVTELRPELTVAVLEAKHVGAGATGRSTGIVSPGLSMPLARFRRQYGDRAAVASFDATFNGVRLLRELIANEGIDCDARDEPHTLVALTDRSIRRMRAHIGNLAEIGREVSWLSPTELVELAGPGYRGGFAYRDAMVVDPYRLLSGLAASLRTRGVAVYEWTPVTDIVTAADSVRLTTSGGQVRARRAVIATDGYSGKLNPMKTSVIPLRTHLLATAPLTDRQLAQLGWKGRGAVIDQRTFFNYYRMTADKRIVFGGGPAVLPSNTVADEIDRSRGIQERVRDELVERFPVLADVEIDAAWSGVTASSLDRNPVVGPVPGLDGVWFAGSWCGHGISTSVDAARCYAGTLVGEPVPADIPWFRSRAQRIPTTWARAAAVGGYLRILAAADAIDRVTTTSVPVSGRSAPSSTTSFAETDR